MKKKLILLIPLTIGICSVFYALSVQKNLSDELIRLHIIANSDSEYDQDLKLKVRDRICSEVGAEFAAISDKDEYRRTLMNKTEKIQKIADSVLSESDAGYKSRVSLERLYIPRKSYDGIILPEGSYEGLIVRLGDASGKNWWCVVYPPLCFTESTCGSLSPEAKEYLKSHLSAESYSLITEEGIEIKYKFKLIEAIQKAKKIFS